MPDIVRLPASITTCVNQKDGFHLTIVPCEGVSLAGALVTCQVRATARPDTTIFTGSTTSSLNVDNLECDITWTQAQSALLPVTATQQTFYLEIDLALADDPVHPILRFVGKLVVSPGGIFTG